MSLLCEGVDLVGNEALPVRPIRRYNDRHATIAEALDDLKRSRVGFHVSDLMSDAEVVEALDRQLARMTGGVGEHSDQ